MKILSYKLKQYVTEFQITQLPHTQCQTYHFTRNRLLVQYTFILHTIFPWRMADLLIVAAFTDPVKDTSGELVHSQAMVCWNFVQ